jgi:hypothetical protein
MKEDRSRFTRFEQLPNVGAATAGDFRQLGFDSPQQLIGQDPYALYDRLCAITGLRQDPCVIDVFIATTRFMAGDVKAPWWAYTAERKATLAARTAVQTAR